jgi:hypothetical protein
MNDRQLDEALRRLAGDPEPTDADREVSRRALASAIGGAKHRTVRRRPLLLGMVGVVSVLALVAAVVVSQIGRPSAAEAAFGEIARAAEVADPLTIPPQRYAYVSSEQTALAVEPVEAFEGLRDRPLAYLLPETREMWVGDDGTVQLRIAARTPRFFDAQDEADYHAAGYDEIDNIGVAVTQTYTGVTSILDEAEWPTDPDELKNSIVGMLSGSDDRPLTVQILDTALDLLRYPATPPSLRAAALRVIGNLDLALTERTADGGATFTITYDTPERTTLSITVDGEGQLRHESIILLDGDSTLGVPPGTAMDDTMHDPVRMVDSLDKS